MKKELKNTEYSLEKIFKKAKDFLPLLGTDYIEFYVGNAKQAAHFYKTAFGFQSHAYAGLETGLKDRVSYVLKQDKIRIVETLWRIIYSNNEADIYEMNLMRRLTGLLYVDNKLMGDIKEKIKKEFLK